MTTIEGLERHALLMVLMPQRSEADASVTLEAADSGWERGAYTKFMKRRDPPETGVISMLGSCVCAVGILCLPASPVGRGFGAMFSLNHIQINHAGSAERTDPVCTRSYTEGRQQCIQHV